MIPLELLYLLGWIFVPTVLYLLMKLAVAIVRRMPFNCLSQHSRAVPFFSKNAVATHAGGSTGDGELSVSRFWRFPMNRGRWK